MGRDPEIGALLARMGLQGGVSSRFARAAAAYCREILHRKAGRWEGRRWDWGACLRLLPPKCFEAGVVREKFVAKLLLRRDSPRDLRNLS